MIVGVSVLIPLIALIWYGALLLIVLRRDLGNRVHRFFSLYLLCMIIWSFAAFMIFANLGIKDTLFWNRLMLLGSLGMPVAFYGFVQAFLNKRRMLWFWLGCLSYGIVQIANEQGHVIREAHVENGLLYNQYGSAVAIPSILWAVFVGASALDLTRGYRATNDVLYRNRVRYVLIVVMLLFIGGLTNVTVLVSYPADIAFNAFCALIITYAMLRYQLLDITVVVRKGLLYSIPTIIIGTGYFLLISLATSLLRAFAGPQIFLLSVTVAIIAAVVAQPVRAVSQLWIDRLFFREKYDSALMLRALSQTAASVLDLNSLTKMILDEVTAMVHIERAAFLLREETSGDFVLAAQRGLGTDGHLSLTSDHPIVDWLSNHNEALYRQHMDVIPQFRGVWIKEREELEKLRAELFIPLRAKGGLVGIFVVGPKLSEEAYSQDDELTLTTLANHTAMAIENARLYEVAQQELAERRRAEEALRKAHDELEGRVQERTSELARVNEALRKEIAERKRAEEALLALNRQLAEAHARLLEASHVERQRLARELHDSVAQMLYAVTLLAEAARRQLASGMEMEVGRGLQEVRDMARRALHEMRLIIFQLRPSVLEEEGLVAALRSRLESVEARAAMETEFRADMYARLPVAMEVELYGIAQEALNNVMKHSQAQKVVMSLRSEDGKVYLEVSDDGKGFDPTDAWETRGLGLRGMQERVARLGGVLKIDSVPGKGTSVRVEVGVP